MVQPTGIRRRLDFRGFWLVYDQFHHNKVKVKLNCGAVFEGNDWILYFLSLLNGISLQKGERQFYNCTAILAFSTKYFGVHLFRAFFIIKPELVCLIAIDRITGLVIVVLEGNITYLQKN